MQKIGIWAVILSTAIIAVRSRYYNSLEDITLIKEYIQEIENIPTNHAKVVRELVHNSDWAAVGTISEDPKMSGFPMVNVISIADGRHGTIYFMLVDLDFTGKDWRKRNNVTFLFTEDVNSKCKNQHKDPMEPTCARAMISGKINQIDMKKNSIEHKIGIDTFLKKHPAGRNWIAAHQFYLCKLDIEHIYVLDFYGGPHEVTADQYYNATITVEDLNEIYPIDPMNALKKYKIPQEM